jgi:hypothetical protein
MPASREEGALEPRHPFVTVEILHVADCALLPNARAVVADAVVRSRGPVAVEERVAACASPTVLIDGVDATGCIPTGNLACRLDVPTVDQVVARLFEANRRRATTEEQVLAGLRKRRG